MAKLYPVKLMPAEREKRRALITKGSHAALCQRRARTLLLADEGRSDQGIAAALPIARATVERTRRRCVEEGREAALQRHPQRRPSRRPKPAAAQKIDGRFTTADARLKRTRLYPSTQP